MAEHKDTEIAVRSMRRKELKTFCAICRENGYHAVNEKDTFAIHTLNPDLLLVATSATGKEIKGVCIVRVYNPDIRLIGGIGVRGSHRLADKVRTKLFEEACSRFRDNTIEATVPEGMGPYLASLSDGWVKRWDIERYTAFSDELVLPLRKVHSENYEIREQRDGCNKPFTLHYDDTFEKAILVQSRNPKPFTSLKLLAPNSEKVIGYGMVDRNADGKLIIGPIYGLNEIVVEAILCRTVACIIVNEKDRSQVIMNVVKCTDRIRKLITKIGFEKSSKSWSRFSRSKAGSIEDIYEDADQVIFALECPAFSLF